MLPLHYHFFGRFVRRISAATLTAVMQFPAFLSSCTRESAPLQQTQIKIEWTTKGPAPEAIDLFFFDTLGVQLLDSYQQLLLPQDKPFGVSGSGPQRLVALSGKAGEKGRWAQIRTYGNLRKHSFSLARESVSSPLLCAEVLLQEGTSRQTRVHLRPMLTAIRLHSVSCDFSGRPYALSYFVNTQTFLSFAGSEYMPLGEEEGKEPVSWMNPGYLDTAAVRALPDPEMLWQKGLGEVGRKRIYPNRTFYCYPGNRTHLVLEGHIGETVCYYPIPLPPLTPDTCLDLDITLKRMGSPSPDIPAESGAVVVELTKRPWEEREPYTEIFG